MTSPVLSRLPIFLGVLSLLWFVGVLVLRVVAARIAASFGRGSLLSLLVEVGWLFERNRPWSRWSMAFVVWVLGWPLVMVAMLLGSLRWSL